MSTPNGVERNFSPQVLSAVDMPFNNAGPGTPLASVGASTDFSADEVPWDDGGPVKAARVLLRDARRSSTARILSFRYATCDCPSDVTDAESLMPSICNISYRGGGGE